MRDATTALLTALQFGDGQFPSGAFAFSWGLESLHADGMVTRAEFAGFVAGQMQHRWATFDAILVRHAHTACDDLAHLIELDDLTDAMLTGLAARLGSRRAGAALLGTHVRLGTPRAAEMKTAMDAGLVEGHMSVVQGAMLANVGLDTEMALAVSAYGTAQGFCTAALRLGLIGHLDAQRALSWLRPLLNDLIGQVGGELDDLASFAPVIDIAMMRHADRATRLFSN